MVRKPAVARNAVWKSTASRRLQKAAGEAGSVEEAISKHVSELIAGVTCPPTDLNAIGQKIGVTAIVSEALPASGELRRDGKNYVVAFSSELPPTRRRFTIAHEFGHVLLERCGARNVKDSPELERLCDAIASELLLPRELFLAETQGEVSAQGVLDVAKKFETSVVATARRFHELRNLNVFLANTDDVEWGFGVVRRGPVAGLDADLRRLVETRNEGHPSSGRVFINTGTTSGQWNVASVGLGRTGIALFSIHPIPRAQWVRPT